MLRNIISPDIYVGGKIKIIIWLQPKIAQLIKGESSYWINKNKIIRDYIANQEEHPKKYTSQQKYDKFIERYGFDIVKH